MNDSSAELIQINQESLKTLIRGITYFQEEFSLILAVCNYRTLREQIVQQLREQCPVQIRELVLEKSVQTLYTRIAEELGAQQPKALMIVGLESVRELDPVLTATNQIREEFRNFNFPVVLWVTDAILYKLIRLIPDFHSWATTVEFQMTVDELIKLIRQTVDEVFAKVLNSSDRVFLDNGALDIENGSPRCAELKSACEELQGRGVMLDLELEAGLEFVLGRIADNSDVTSRHHYEQSLALWKQTGDRARCGLLLFYIGLWWRNYAVRHRVEHQQASDRARDYFQQSIAAFEQADRPDLAAKFINFLAEVLHRLKHWHELELVAQKALVLHQTHYDQFRQARVYGFLAEVELSKPSCIDEAKQAAEQALILLNDAITKTISNPSPEQSDLLDLERSFHQGWYLFSLAKAQQKLGQLSEAIATLETARDQTKPQYDPQHYIDILTNLRECYFQQRQYLNAFQIKQQRQAIESQFGFRAFIGAGRLRPKQQIANPPLLSAESQDEVAQEITSSGRLQSVKDLLNRIDRPDCKLTIIHGESGVGKSSIEQAGLIPALKQKRINTRSVLPVLQQVYENWVDELAKCLAKELVNIHKSDVGLDSATLSLTDSLLAKLRKNVEDNLLTILIFDQFEEFFFICKDSVQRKIFYDFLRACLDIPYVKVIISLREDSLPIILEFTRLTNFDVINNNILDKNIIFYLGNFKPDEAKLVIQSLTEKTQFELEPALIDELVKDLAGEANEVRPVELQIVGAQLQSENITTLAQYQKKGPKAALVARFLEEVIKDCGSENKQLAEVVLWLLTDENSTRPLRTRDDLKKGLEDLLTDSSDLELVLKIFVKSGLVLLLPGGSHNRYQLVHDYLVDFVRRQKNNELIEELKKERAQSKRSESELKRSESELNRVLKRQLKLAMAGGSIMAVLAVLAGVFGVAAKIGETNAELKQISANSESLWASNKELEALVEGLKAGKKLKYGWKIEPNTKNQVVSRLQEVVYNVRDRNRLEGHTDTIADISFSPDGKFIASGSKDKTVKVWNREGSEKKPALQGKYGNEFTSVAFSPDSQILAAGNKDSKIYLWRLNGTLITTLKGHSDWVRNIRFSPDGKTIVSASRDNSVRLWKIDGTQKEKLEGHNSTVNIVRFSPDGQRIASASEDGTIKLWSLKGKQLQSINSPGVLDLAFSRDSKTLSVASRDNTLKIWKIDGRILLTTSNFIALNSPFFACFSPDGKWLVTIDGINQANVLHIEGSKIEALKRYFRLPHSTSGSFSPDAKNIALASNDNVVKLVSLDSETLDINEEGINKSNIIGLSPDNLPVSIDDNQLKFWNSDGTVKNSIELADRMKNVSFSRDDKLIALMGTQVTTKLWNSKEKLLNTFELNGSFPEASPDGKLMVTVERNNTAKLWRTDGKLIGSLPGHKARITKVIFSGDSQLIATVSQDNIVKLWTQDGKLISTLQGHTKKIPEVIFSPDSQLIATVSWDNTVKLWNRDGLLIQTIEKSSGSLNLWTYFHNSQVRFSRDSQILFVPSNYNDVQLWGRNGKVIPTLKGHNGPVYSAIFSPNSQIIATLSFDRQVKLWRRNGAVITTFPANFYNVSFSPDSQLIVSVGSSVKLLDSGGKEIATLADNSDDSRGISFSPDSKTIILIAKDNVKLYNRAVRLIGTIKNDENDVHAIRVSQDGRLIASVDRNNVIKLSSSNNGKLIKLLKGHHSKITLVTFSPDSKMLATADEDNKVKLWQSDGKLILNLQGHGNRVERVDFGADGKTFAVSGVEDVVQLWNREHKKIVATLKGHRDRINSVSFNPTSQLVASASDDKTVRLWDFDGHALHILDKHTDKVNRVRFSQDGKILASASNDKSVNIWNSKGQFIKSLNKEHKSPVQDVIFNHNSSTIASASDDSTVILWDYPSGKLKHRLSGHSASVKSLSFSPKGEMLASADGSGAVKIWSRDGIMLKSFNQDSFTGDNISFNSDGQQIFTWMRGTDNYYYRKPLLWSMNLNNLLKIGCQKAGDYLNNNPNLQKNDRSLCGSEMDSQ